MNDTSRKEKKKKKKKKKKNTCCSFDQKYDPVLCQERANGIGNERWTWMKKVAGFNGLSDALRRLDFRSAVHDERRFPYTAKLLELLLSQRRITTLSGCAQKSVLNVLEEIAVRGHFLSFSITSLSLSLSFFFLLFFLSFFLSVCLVLIFILPL